MRIMVILLKFSSRSNLHSRRLMGVAYKAPGVAVSSVDKVMSIQAKHCCWYKYNRLDGPWGQVVNVPLHCVWSRWPCNKKDASSRKCSQRLGRTVRAYAFKIRDCRCGRKWTLNNTCVCAYLLQIERLVDLLDGSYYRFTDKYCNDSHFVLVLIVIFISTSLFFCHRLYTGIIIFCKMHTYNVRIFG